MQIERAFATESNTDTTPGRTPAPPWPSAAAEFEQALAAVGMGQFVAELPAENHDTQDDGANDTEQAQADASETADNPGALPYWAAPTFNAGALAAAMSPTPPNLEPSAWAEVSACIEQLLITDSRTRRGAGAALFRLAPELLEDTTVALSRTDSGWLLQIDSQDPRLHGESERQERSLRERFARGGYGELTIEHARLPRLAP
jgi:hypothetical protein